MLFIFFILTAILSLIIFFSKNNILQNTLTVVYLLALAGISVYAYFHLGETDSVYYKFDAIGVLFSAVLSILCFATFYHGQLYLKRNNLSEKQRAMYHASSIMFITAMISAYFAENFALLWVSVEATTLFVSILIYVKRTNNALEATWKYLFVSSFGLAIAFIGILFLSIVASGSGAGSLNFNNLLLLVHKLDIAWLKIAFILMVTGFSVKISVFPLFSVAVDAKTVAPSPVNALMSTALVNVGFISIFRIYVIMVKTDALIWAQHLLIIVAVISIFLAVIQITRIKRLKRMYAFSSMEHMGIVLLGLAMGGIGYYAAILHLVFHSFVKAGLFYQIGAIHRQMSTMWIKDMGNYFRKNAMGGLAFILGIISILAIPPSGLFISEFLTFKALFEVGHYYIGIAVLALLTVIIYLVLKNTFHILFNNSELTLKETAKANPFETISQFVLFGLVVYLGINPPAFFTDLIHSAISILTN